MPMILAEQYPTYKPAMRIISAITNDYPATVTTSFDHLYLSGLIVRINVPNGFGMVQANQLYAPITVTGATTFTVDIDTTGFDPFADSIVFPSSYQRASVVPIGEVNESLLQATENVLPY
jgi:hypothetical protein